MTRRGSGAVLLAAALVGCGMLAGRATGSGSRSSVPGPGVSTTVVARTSLVSTELVDGTLGFAQGPPVINRLAGIYTALAPEGSTVTAGGVLYRVDNLPVVLFRGAVPAWRALGAGAAAGPDIAQLQANLKAVGDAAGLIGQPNGRFDAGTAAAVRRWQTAAGLAATGVVDLGRVVFLPGAVRVGTAAVPLGSDAAPGQQPFTATSSQRVVTVPLDAGRQDEVHPGDPVTIDLAGARTVAGTITDVGRVATARPDQGNGSPPSPTVTVTVVPTDPATTGTLAAEPVQVELTAQSAANALAVPITALLALAEGGYGVEVVEPSGAHRLVGVHTGLFANTLVQISGTGIDVGTRVVVAQ